MLERIKKLKEALLLERAAELSRYTSLLDDLGIKERIIEGITLYPIAFLEESYTIFDDLILSFKINEAQDPYKFSSNGSVQLFHAQSPDKIEGVIYSFKEGVINVRISADEMPDWIKSGKLGLDALPDTRTTDIQLKTLDKILADELRIASNFYKNGRLEQYDIPSTNYEGYNLAQNQAINHLISSNPFHIVHGPPGTGKTKTLVKAILLLAALGKRIMVAAGSNTAVDHITFELSKENKSITRVGNSFKISTEVEDFTLRMKTLTSPLMDVVIRLKKESEIIRKKVQKYKRSFGKEEFEERKMLKRELSALQKDIRGIENEIAYDLLDTSQIITGTFMGLQDKRLSKFNFDAVFVDEAGQALEPAIWSVAHFAPKLFLAGDPLQLPPTLLSQEAEKLGLAVSLIEKGIELGNSTTLLDVQYRMNDQIMQFSNQQFYESKLSSADLVISACLIPDDFEPVEFIDTAGSGYEEEQDELGGIFNLGEINLIQQRLETIEVSERSIGIISPYRLQINKLREVFPEQKITIQTIDGFQGQEKEVIILSLVRSNKTNTIGFLKDYRRMNVAMTRAKLKLIVIGDSSTLGKDRFYEDFLNYVEKNGSYRSAWEFMI